MKQSKGKVDDIDFINAHKELNHLGKLSLKFQIPLIEAHRKCVKLGLKVKNGGYAKPVPLDEILDGQHGYYPTGKLKKRLLDSNILKYKCDICDINEWNGCSLVLHLDHKDGNSTNHKKNNLRLLCPNCHSQTDTYCGKNKG